MEKTQACMKDRVQVLHHNKVIVCFSVISKVMYVTPKVAKRIKQTFHMCALVDTLGHIKSQ